MPKVKIVIVSYNQDGFVEECIKSALAQTYENIKIVVVDNFSSNENSALNTKLIAQAYGVEFIQRQDSSLTKCLNYFLFLEDVAQFKYFNFIAADDILIHNKIELQVSMLEAESAKIAGCFGNAIRIDGQGSLLGCNKIVTKKTHRFEDVFLKRVDLYAPTALYRVSSLVEVGGFDESHGIEDLSIYLKLTSKGYSLLSIANPLVLYRIHPNNTHTKYKWMMTEKLKIWSDYSMREDYKLALNNIYLEHFSNFGSTDKKNFLKILPKVMFCVSSKYFWIGWLRFIFDWRQL